MHNRNRGALLIEALISFFLMFVVALTVFGLQAQARRAKGKARATVAANSFARQLIEQARSAPSDELSNGLWREQNRVVRYRAGETDGVVRMVGTVRVSDGPATSLKSVLATVTWHSGTVTLEAYRAAP